MRIPGSMLLAATLMTAAGVAAAPASAAERLTDVAYMTASRCAGLAEAGQVDVTAVKALLDAQRGARDLYIQDKGEEMRQDAVRESHRAKGGAKQRIAAELDGVCKSYLAGSKVASR